MYPRNAASPERMAIGPVVQISDGVVQTSEVSVKVVPQGASASAGGGTISYEEGVVGYVPTQAETNHTSFQLIAYKSGCVPAAVTVVTTATSVPGTVDVGAISGDAAAADALELQYDGTGLTGDAYPATQAQVGNIATTGAAAYQAASSFTGTTVGTVVNDYTYTDTSNASYHQIQDSGAGGSPANTLNCYYEFQLRPDEVAVGIQFKGRMQSSPATGDSFVCQAWNWTGTPAAWVTLFAQSAVTGSTDVVQTPSLVGKYTSTGADAGKVRIRFYGTSLSSTTLYVDQLIVAKASTSRTVGYSNGSIWVKSSGSSGTTLYVNGTADNPCPWADALTINASLGLGRYIVTPGSSITLDAALAGAVVSGRSYALALGGQNVSGTYFEGVEGLSGIGTCAAAEAIIVDSHINALTIGEADFIRCHLMDTITMSQASVPYRFHDCAGIGPGKITFSAANQTAVVSNASGVLTIAGMVSTNTLYIDGNCDLTLDATNTAGTVYIAGAIRLTNNGSGQTIVDSARWDDGQSVGGVTGMSAADISRAVWDEDLGGHAGDGSAGAALAAAEVAADPWAADLPGAYAEGSAGYMLGDLWDRIEDYLESGEPAIVVPAPAEPTQTAAYCLCLDEEGAPESGVEIEVRLRRAPGTTGTAYDSVAAVGTSNAQGVATVLIPRSADLTFEARRGTGRWVQFDGVDAATLELPATLGTA